MTFNLGNGAHVEWQSLDLFSSVDAAAQTSVVTTPLTGLPDSWSRVVKFAGNANPGGVSYVQYGEGVSDPTNVAEPTTNHIIWQQINK